MQSSVNYDFQNACLEDGSMNIFLTDAGKRFNRDWIFRHLNYIFQQGKSYAITGPNGSGKSTLLQTIAGAITPSEGEVEYSSEKEIENFQLRVKEQEKELSSHITTQNAPHRHRCSLS
jgi:ABC-type multidrug transport system ATPase subunit